MASNTIEYRFTFSDAERAETKSELLKGIANRIAWHEEKQTLKTSTLKTLEKCRKEIENADAMTLDGARGMGLDSHYYTSQIVVSACRNLYSLKKIPVLCRVIQGSAFGSKGDDATLFSTIIAIAEGRNAKEIENRVNVICSALGMGELPPPLTYGAGQTQSGSSVAALQALKILATKHGERDVINPELWGVLVKAAKAALKKHCPDIPFTPIKGK